MIHASFRVRPAAAEDLDAIDDIYSPYVLFQANSAAIGTWRVREAAGKAKPGGPCKGHLIPAGTLDTG